MKGLSRPLEDEALIAELEEQKNQQKREYKTLSRKLQKLRKYKFQLKQMELERKEYQDWQSHSIFAIIYNLNI